VNAKEKIMIIGEAATQGRLAMSIQNAAAQIDVSVPFLRKEIRLGNLKAKKVCRRVLISVADLKTYIENQPDWKPTNSNGEEN
jgi:excisionase family DNA binding protein